MIGTNFIARSALLAGTAMALVATPALAQDAASAQTPAAPQNEQAIQVVETGEVVVTARRRAEQLQDVPIAITAYSGVQLERQGAVDITDIGDTTPNVTLEVSRGTNSTLTAFIRGIGQQDPVAGFEQGVGLYLDDVYLNRPQGAVLDIYDVERIEVLRGPQGTLYGRNTIGGAIKYVTRRLADDPALKLRGTVGTYGQLDAVATASYPIADLIRVGASAARLTRDGFGKNFTTGKDNYDKNVRAGRVSVEIGRDEAALLRLSADYTKDTSNPRGGHRLIAGLVSKAPVLDSEYDTRGELDDPTQKVISKGVAAHGQIGLGEGLTAKSITALRRDTSGTPIDFDALAAIDFDVPAIYENKQFSQEFQLAYDRGPLSGLLGAYYLDAAALTAFDVRLYTFLPAFLPGFTATTSSDVDTKTWAIFGDLTFDVSDQLSVSVGGRYTNDKRQARTLRQSRIRGGSPDFGGIPPFGIGTGFGANNGITSQFEGQRTDTAFTPRASISFKPTPDHHFYASYSQGFKGGGFDPRGQTTQAPDEDGDGDRDAADIYEYMAFEPEKVTSYELGWKGSLFDKRVFAGVALFNANYKDMQIPASIGCVIGGLPNFCGLTSNAGKARIRGVEVEGNARLFGSPGGPRVNFAWTLGYLDGKFKEFLTFVAISRETGLPIPIVEVDVADDRKIQNTPKWTASGTLSFAAPFAGGNLNLSSTLSYRSKSQQFEIRTAPIDQKGFALLDASATYDLPGGNWSFGLHGKNLTDTRYKSSGYNFLFQNPYNGNFINTAGAPVLSPAGGLGKEGVLSAFYGNPRQVLVTLGYKF